MTIEHTNQRTLEAIVELSRTIGRPENDLVILAEGNTSMRTDGNHMLVKASGSSLMNAGAEDFVEVNLPQFMELITSGPQSDDYVAEVMRTATVQGTKKPSVESLLHAVCLDQPEVHAVVHTHPVAVNSLLCSDRADVLVDGSLFPDQIVVLGRRPLLVPYVDPGLPLAQEINARLTDYIATHGVTPKVIYLLNHGMFALGKDAEEAIQITNMAVKCARVILGALAIGKPTYLTTENEERIDTRPDEIYRRQMLSGI
jgi:rhamnose utilization protein RhaD (predicted bifunctional aldolase and dehydrogenase)